MLASNNGHPEAQKMLLEAGADVNIQMEVRDIVLCTFAEIIFWSETMDYSKAF